MPIIYATTRTKIDQKFEPIIRIVDETAKRRTTDYPVGLATRQEDDAVAVANLALVHLNSVIRHHLVLLAQPDWKPPYGVMCREPSQCLGLGYCPRDPTCGD